MTTVTFHPARLHGSALVPPAKSEAHRSLLLAALGRGDCRLHGFPPPLCDDTQAMINGVTAMGASVVHEADTLLVHPAPPSVVGAPMAACDVHACAAALRMLIPAFLVRGQAVRFTMEPALFARPLDAFEPFLEAIGGTMVRTPAGGGRPATVELSGVMRAGSYEVDGSRSSQFASGLLIALSKATDTLGRPAPSRLTIGRPIVSRPYLDMTLRLMETFGAPYAEKEEGVFEIEPRGKASPGDISISGDWSQGAVLLCANALGCGVMIGNLCGGAPGTECLQGDARVLDVLSQMGLRLYRTHGELYAVSPSRPGLMPVRLDCSDIPDLAPILALTCTQARGTSTLSGVGRLRLKECDRLSATVGLLGKLGAHVKISADGDVLTVEGPTPLHGGFEADALHDHRMVMLLAVAALSCDAPITVRGADALHKSWPGFLDAYRALGGKIS